MSTISSSLPTEPASNESGGSGSAARVIGVNGNIVTIETDGRPVRKNEVAYVVVGDERLRSEVLRIYGRVADLQVFEETHGIRYGDPVELTSQLLSVTLGPGMMGQIFDGLQKPLRRWPSGTAFSCNAVAMSTP